ncbi:MAG: NAD(P)(+) transhydrogenase (Re/Si-specific) subunit beta, partial [Clostridia bacterium]|nr:NAD(P)(+) transhydrogenase (Re/Si-specific) subunit beta [Clostridia bacterium]
MSKIAYSKIGNRVSGICMFVAIVLTVIYSSGNVFGGYGVYAAWPIYIGLVAGAIVGLFLAKKVTMLQMPQMVALLNGLGGAASALVGAFSMFAVGVNTADKTSWIFANVTSALALAVGMVTLLGSLVAAGKLHRILPQKPVVIKNNQKLHISLQMFSAALMVVGVIVFSATAHLD